MPNIGTVERERSARQMGRGGLKPQTSRQHNTEKKMKVELSVVEELIMLLDGLAAAPPSLPSSISTVNCGPPDSPTMQSSERKEFIRSASQ